MIFRRKMVTTGALRSRKLANVNAYAERLYWRIYMASDSYGTIGAEPWDVLQECLAGVADASEAETARALDELVAIGLLQRWRCKDGDLWVHVIGHDKHQQPQWLRRRGHRRTPVPPTLDESETGLDQTESNDPSRESGLDQTPSGLDQPPIALDHSRTPITREEGVLSSSSPSASGGEDEADTSASTETIRTAAKVFARALGVDLSVWEDTFLQRYDRPSVDADVVLECASDAAYRVGIGEVNRAAAFSYFGKELATGKHRAAQQREAGTSTATQPDPYGEWRHLLQNCAGDEQKALRYAQERFITVPPEVQEGAA